MCMRVQINTHDVMTKLKYSIMIDCARCTPITEAFSAMNIERERNSSLLLCSANEQILFVVKKIISYNNQM